MRSARQLIRKYGKVTGHFLDFVAGFIFAVSVVTFQPDKAEKKGDGATVKYVVDELKKARMYGIIGVATMMLSFFVKVLSA